MKFLPARLFALLALALLLGGCASFEANINRGRSLKDVRRFFVVSNSNDNRAVDRQIALALKARDRTADVGPLTMMPDDTQAVVTFQDHWAWDFGEHLYYLKVSVRDPSASEAYASVVFSAKVPLREKPAVTVDRLVEALLKK